MKYLLFTFICAGAALAQSDRGTITGTVLDPANAVVTNAKISAKNLAAGTLSETTSTQTGNYTLPSLPAGTYEVVTEAAGFKRAIRTGVVVEVSGTTRLDVRLDVGATTDSVTITADAALLKTESAEQSLIITGEKINALPLNFGGGPGSTGAIRNWLSFSILSPGVSGTGYNSPINGAAGGTFKVYLEGQDVTSGNDTTWTSSVAAASVEAIGEFSMQTSNFSAEFGQVTGGLYNFTTKSGTNQFHGSAYEYFANEALDASQHFTHARGIDRKSDWGFSVGGPVRIPKVYDGRNKTFFFFNFEDFHDVSRSAGTLATVPTAAYRTGDFSAALTGKQIAKDPLGNPVFENVIFDPLSNYVVNGVTYRTAFPGNIIPQNRIDPVAAKIQGLIPAPINNNLVLNWLPNTANHKFQTLPSAKIDHNIGSNIRLSAYYSVQNTDQITSPDGLPIPITVRRDQLIYGHTSRLNYDQTISSKMVMHLGVGYLRFHNPDSAPTDVLTYDMAGQTGFKGSAIGTGFPRLNTISTGSYGGEAALGPTNANSYYNDKLTSVASLSYVRDNHTIKLGAEFKQEAWTSISLNGAPGTLNFSANETGSPALLGANLGGLSNGLNYASFLLGAVDSASVSPRTDPQWRKKAWSLYLQDNWKITRKLTLDYGLRWDLESQGHEIHDRVSGFSSNVVNPSAGGLKGGYIYGGNGAGRCNCNLVSTYPYAIGPRLGAAYQINDKTVLRAGWGLTYSGLANWWYLGGGNGVGWNTISFSTPNYGEPALYLKNGLQYNPADLSAGAFNPGLAPSPGQLNSPSTPYDPNGGRPGRINQWNIALQREIVKNLSVEAAFVGNRGAWLEANNLDNPNAIDPAKLQALGLDISSKATQTLLTSTFASGAPQKAGFLLPYAGFPASATLAQALRPFPQFNGSLIPRWAPLGKSWYDALQVKVTKRYSHGLDMQASFTYQNEEALGAGGNPGPGGGGINNVFAPIVNQKSLSSFSTPFILVTSFNYQVPRIGRNAFVKKVLGDWTIGGLLRYASGSLIAVPGSNNSLNSLIFQNTRFNRVAGQPLFLNNPNCGCINPNKNVVLNPAAWSDAPAGQWGVSAAYYNDYRWQHQATENLNIGRTFRIRERTTFQVRAEFFNVFNRLYLPGPTSGNPQAPATFNSAGVPTGGFGYINGNSVNNQRNGQLVARFQF